MGKTDQRLSPIGWAGMIVGGGLTFYWMHTYTGPFEWFAELQLRLMGQYTEKVTFLLTFLVAYGALALVYLPVRWALRSGVATGAAGAGANAAVPANRNLSRISGSFVVGLVGLGFAVAGLVQYQRAQHAGELADVPITSLEGGKAPASRWVRVSGGYAVPEAVVTMQTNRNKSCFVPVVSSLTLDPTQSKIHLFLKYPDERSLPGRSERPVVVQGMLEHNDLPGPLRVSLEREAAIDPNDYYVLDPKQTPAKAMHDASIMAYIGLGMFGVAAIIALVAWLRRPSSPVDQPAAVA